MESVEVWMWLIAGMIMAGLVFTGGYKFLAYYTHNVEVSNAQENFAILSGMTQKVCMMGLESREQRQITFPYIVQNLTTEGKDICITLKGEEPYCQELKCTLVMNPGPIDLMQKDNFFVLVQKAVGRGTAAKYNITIMKTGQHEVQMGWTRVLADV